MSGRTALIGNSNRALREFASGVERRNRWIAVAGGVLGAVLGIAYNVSPVLPLAILISGGVIFCIAQYPKSTLFVLFAAACLFEQFPRDFPDSLTDRVPFFWNLNTVFEVYTRSNIKLIPLNVMEMFLGMAALCQLTRGALTSTITFKMGTLLWPMLMYLVFVVLALFNGLMAGADYRMAMQDVRAQIYFPLSYLLAVNLVESKTDLVRLLWLLVLCVGLKGVLYTFRRYVTLAAVEVSDQGVGSHEEVLLFGTFIILLLVLRVFDLHPKLRLAMILMLPTVIIGDLACNRRAGIAALIIVLPIFLLIAIVALPARRHTLVCFGLLIGISFLIYYQAFSRSSSLFAQPARAVRSQFDPDQRDAASDRYREAESLNLMTTVRASPVIGWGYGREFLTPMDLSYASNVYEYGNIWAHNTILSVWMRTGTIGFFCFWMMMVAALLRVSEVVRGVDIELAGLALFAISILIMWLLIGLLDMGLTQFRSVILTGIFIGAMDRLHQLKQGVRCNVEGNS